MAAKDIFEAVGLGTPFYLAAATYGFFYWLDRNASAQAIRAISRWLKGQSYKRIDLGSAIEDIFDRIYSSRLLRMSAFIRSAAITSVVCVIMLFLQLFVYSIEKLEYNLLRLPFIITITSNLAFYVAVVLSDYASLFVVRSCLRYASKHFVASLILAILLICTVILLFNIFLWTLILPTLWLIDWTEALDIQYNFPFWHPTNAAMTNALMIAAPALAVHLWLPFLALGAIGMRFLYAIFRAVEWAQWFLKQGERHPLRAIGMVAGVLVFVGTVAWRVVVSK